MTDKLSYISALKSSVQEREQTILHLFANGVITEDAAANMLGMAAWLPDDQERAPFDLDRSYQPRVCECGAAKAGTAGHSTWCPMRADP